MPFSRDTNNKILDHFNAKATWTSPAGIFVGFSSTTPTTTGTTVTEPSGGAYARQQITAANWDAAANSVTANSAVVTFPTATADWVSGANLTHIVLYSAVTAGTFLGFIPITTPRAVLNNDTAKILAGELDLVINEV